METISLFFLKAKSYLIATLIAFMSATVRHVEYKRKYRDGDIPKDKVKLSTLTDWFLFGVMASIITWTGLAIIEELGYNLNMAFSMLLFWLGYMTNYLYQWVPKYLKKQLGKIMND